MTFSSCCRSADNEGPASEDSRWHKQGQGSSSGSDSLSDSSDGCDDDDDTCSDMTGIRASAVSVSCEDVKLRHHSSGEISTTCYPNRLATSHSEVLWKGLHQPSGHCVACKALQKGVMCARLTLQAEQAC